MSCEQGNPYDTTDRPSAKSETNAKVAYLAGRVVEYRGKGDEPTPDDVAIARDTLVDLIDDEYGFEPRTLSRYVDLVVDELDLVTHPRNEDVFLGRDEHDVAIESLRREERDAVGDEFDAIEDADTDEGGEPDGAPNA